MKVSRWVVPVLIVLLIAVGLFGADTFAIPSLTIYFPEDEKTAAESIRTVVFVVDGVKCVDTARTASSTLEEIPGVIRYVAYASHNRVEITYDATRTGVESPTRSNSILSITLRKRSCILGVMSPISSRKIVPPSAF